MRSSNWQDWDESEDNATDPAWRLAIRERRYNATKKAILAKNGKDFTAVSLIPEVKRHVWSHERWDITQTGNCWSFEAA